MRRFGIIGIVIAAALAALPASAQLAGKDVMFAWAPKPLKLTPYEAPNRPVWRLADIIAAHKGQKSWSQIVARDADYTVTYIQMAPGEKTRPLFWADDRMFGVVLSGQIRFSIQGQQPFTGTKGFLVNVPFRNAYSLEVAGDAPAIFFQVTRTGRVPLYPFVAGEGGPAAPGLSYQKVSYNVTPDVYKAPNRPFVDFEKDYVAANKVGSTIWVQDDGSSSFVIRGKGVPLPPDSNRGHFHIDYAESWLILEGQIDYRIEGEKMFTAGFGDYVYVPHGRWHRASFHDGAMDTRMSITPRVYGMHNFGPDTGAKQ